MTERDELRRLAEDANDLDKWDQLVDTYVPVEGVTAKLIRMCDPPTVLALLDQIDTLTAEANTNHGAACIDKRNKLQRERDALRKPTVMDAVRDVLWKATQYGVTDDGDTAAYIIPKGALHHLVGAMIGVGESAPLRSPLATVNETTEPVDADAACAYWLSRWSESANALVDVSRERDGVRAALADAVRQAKLDVLDEAVRRLEQLFSHVGWPDYDGAMNNAKDMLAELRREVEESHPCGDYPAPCNCDDPVRHGGRA